MKPLFIVAKLIALVHAGLRFPCSTLTIQRLDPVVQPGIAPSSHVSIRFSIAEYPIREVIWVVYLKTYLKRNVDMFQMHPCSPEFYIRQTNSETDTNRSITLWVEMPLMPPWPAMSVREALALPVKCRRIFLITGLPTYTLRILPMVHIIVCQFFRFSLYLGVRTVPEVDLPSTIHSLT